MPTDGYIQCNTDGAGKKVRTRYQTIGDNEVHSEVNGLEDVAGNQINPAKEDGNLASIKTNTDNLADIKTDTGNIPKKSTSANIYNVTMTNADTEYSQALPSNCKKFLIHTRDGTSFRLAFVTGKVATPTEPYFTIPASQSYYEDFIEPSSLTLYFACGTAGKTVEIIAWS
ncbi:hypothetical protein KEJ39_03935 [Candidatus Bathyarchaeota archaeon]|nr:hypothetical protein [Candidatus Bathyarchaeota archaeon]